MNSLLRTTSIKAALSWVVMLICSVTLLASLTISTLQDISFQKKKLIDQLHAYANIIAFNSVAGILYDDPEIEENRLKSFAAVDILHNIHIYKLTAETGELSFFSSYNRRDVGPHPTQFTKVSQLQQPQFEGDIVEISKVVEFEGKKLGYIYIRASMEELSKYVQSRILFDLLIAVIALLCAYFIVDFFKSVLPHRLKHCLQLCKKSPKKKTIPCACH